MKQKINRKDAERMAVKKIKMVVSRVGKSIKLVADEELAKILDTALIKYKVVNNKQNGKRK